MKKLLIPVLLLLTGCATINPSITIIPIPCQQEEVGPHLEAFGRCAVPAISITITSSIDKPVEVGTTLQGNVPLQGGTVTSPSQVAR